MDPLSQAALGATVGALAGGRQLGLARSAALGAFAGALPDIDILANISGDPFFNLRHHRGVTHALWFGPVVGSLLGWVLWRWHRHRGGEVGLGPWVAVMVVGLLSHPLLDWFTPYGTQFWAPFSLRRFALPAVPVVDPIYTGVLLLGVAIALVRQQRTQTVLGCCLALSTLYLVLGLYSNARVETQVRAELAQQGLAIDRLGVFPTMLQLPLRRVVVERGGEIRVSFVTAWNSCPIEWGPVGKAPTALEGELLAQSSDGRTFAWFTDNWMAMGQGSNGELHYADLRYGFSRQPEQGLWLVSLTPAVAYQGSPAYLRNRPELDWSAVKQLFQAGFGADCRPWSERTGTIS